MDLTKEQNYHYSSLHSTLVRAIKKNTNQWIEYEYDSNGHLTNSRTNEFGQHTQSYEQQGVGHFIIKETPGDRRTEVKFNSGGNIVLSRKKGGLPTLQVFKTNERSFYLDDMVS